MILVLVAVERSISSVMEKKANCHPEGNEGSSVMEKKANCHPEGNEGSSVMEKKANCHPG